MTTLNGAADDMNSFFREIDEVKNQINQYDNNVTRIETLHTRSLSEIDSDRDQFIQKQIDSLVAETSTLSDSIRARVADIASKSKTDPTKNTQANSVRTAFSESVRRFHSVEASYSSKYKERYRRQLKIAMPEASNEQIESAIEDGDGQQIFSQALLNSNRRGEARAALTEVQNRHKDIQKMERTMAELLQLFKEMEEVIQLQAQDVQTVDNTTKRVEREVNKGVEETRGAVKSARAARRKKWICFGIIVIICIILAVVLGAVFGTR
ncbi:t-SNARE [Lipomyces oligophaga]|uniref:t-SNARE n=1 Tax=Lipomyces oligophaga TaxID=45792 RepID=UPI0034CDDF40